MFALAQGDGSIVLQLEFSRCTDFLFGCYKGRYRHISVTLRCDFNGM